MNIDGTDVILSILSYGDLIDANALEDYPEYLSLYSAMTIIPTRVFAIKRSLFLEYLEVSVIY